MASQALSNLRRSADYMPAIRFHLNGHTAQPLGSYAASADAIHVLCTLRTVPTTTRRLIDRLDAALTVLSYCSGSTCSRPFDRIHPEGTVVNLAEAMDPSYDTLYANFQKLNYRRCAEYYDPANELPDPRLVPLEWAPPPPPGQAQPPPPKRGRRPAVRSALP
ncbi:Arylsulfatase [Tetrabaena socialis]|uniref:Arylsulfatase n=1 Tax=Tetrabaena socialis TaxID=47790 RepID=A0A2J8A9D2_9CHLO|nr:Arylsulfatase [Tetrabaena socialis]|eukprot:PNH09105.1 Arylsulfatase [Tetrabaena socialis]